jgi:hypothetical protein
MEANKPAWVELSSTDPAASREFYKTLFGWRIEVTQDPQYGGYGLAYTGDENVAGIGGKQPGDASPSNWSVYIGTGSADETAKKVGAAGGTIVVPPFDVPAQGRMVVFQDPSGAFLSAWEPKEHQGFTSGGDGQFGWAELSARGLQKTLGFYRSVFGWEARTSAATGPNEAPYTEFKIDDESIAGAAEIAPGVPDEVPSYWMPYFNVRDVDDTFKRARDAGATELVPPQDFPGGRFAIVRDPQGAVFGLMRTQPA